MKDTDPLDISIGYNASRFKLVLNRHKKSLPTLGDNQKSFEHLAWLWANLINSAEPQGHLCAITSGSAQLAMLTGLHAGTNHRQRSFLAAFTTAWRGKCHHITALSSSLDFNLGAIHTHYLHYPSNKKYLRSVFDSSVNTFIWT